MSGLSRKTFSILRLDTFCPLQLIAKSEKVRNIKKSLFIVVYSSFMLCRPTLAGNVMWLKFSGVESAPSHYKYKQNIKLNNCAIAYFPESSH